MASNSSIPTELGTENIGKLLKQYALPAIIAQIATSIYNMVDSIYIGQGVGPLAISGLAVTFPLMNLSTAFGTLVGAGAATILSVFLGRKKYSACNKVLSNVVSLNIIIGALFMLVSLLFLDKILYFFGASEQTLPYAREYMKIILYGNIITHLYFGLNAAMRSTGSPKKAMGLTIFTVIINSILDPIFIFTLDMGVQGAALATVISQGISCAWVLFFLMGKKAILRIRPDTIRISLERSKRIMTLGITGFVMQGTNSLVSIVCNNQLQIFGETLAGGGGDLYVGVMTVLNSVRELLSLPVGGIASGGQPVIGYNYGAGEYKRVKEGIRFITLLAGSYTLISWAVVMLIPRVMIGMFTDDVTTIDVGARMLTIYFFGFVFMSLQFAGQCTFQGLGFAKQAVTFALFRKVVIIVPLTLLLPRIGFSVEGVFIAEPVSNILGGLVCFTTMWLTVYKRLDIPPKS